MSIIKDMNNQLKKVPRVLMMVTVLGTTIGLTGCGGSPDAEAPPLLSEGDISQGRDAYFDALQNGNYSELDDIIATLKQESDAGDPQSLAVLGFAHSWKLAEYRRDPSDPSITEHAKLAADAFSGAIKEIPHDARLLGFRGSFRQARGKIENNSLMTALGWFDEVNAATRWPAWGLFTKAYGLITFGPDESLYKQGIGFLWDNLDICAGENVNREAFNLQDYPQLTQPNIDPRIERPCTNTPVAPHNLEGFFLYFGDMYAKASNLDQAETMYLTALEVNQGDWPYADVAAKRIERLQELPALFNLERGSSEQVSVDEINVFQSQISCVACHQGSLE